MTASICDALNQQLRSWQGGQLTAHVTFTFTQPTYPIPHFRMSSLGQCPRKQIASRLGLPPTHPPDDRAIGKMWTGTLVGAGLQEALSLQGFLCPNHLEREVCYRSYVGHLDGYTIRIPEGAIVEIKTTDDNAITRYDYSENYFWQGFGYCLAENLQRLLIFQYGKNQGLKRETVRFLTDEWRQKIDEHITHMDSLWAKYELTGDLPPCEHRFGWEDKLCNYKETS